MYFISGIHLSQQLAYILDVILTQFSLSPLLTPDTPNFTRRSSSTNHPFTLPLSFSQQNTIPIPPIQPLPATLTSTLSGSTENNNSRDHFLLPSFALIQCRSAHVQCGQTRTSISPFTCHNISNTTLGSAQSSGPCVLSCTYPTAGEKWGLW